MAVAKRSLVDFEEFFAIPIKLYKILGIAPYTIGSTRTRKSKLEILLFSSALLSINMVLCWEIKVMSSANILDLTAVMACFLFTLLGQIKILVILFKRNEVDSIIQLMKQQFPKTIDDQEAFDVSNTLKNVLRLEKVYFIVTIAALITFDLFSLTWSLIEYLLDPSKEFIRRFPFYQCPFKVDDLWIYAIAYIQQMHIGLIASNCFLSADVFLFSIISVVLMYFRYIQRQLDTMICEGSEKDLAKLKAIINFHQLTLSMAELTNATFSTTILITFISSVIMICVSAFQTTAPDVPVIQLVSFLMFLLHELVQTGVTCYLGQILIDYSSEISDAVFGHQWYNGNLQYQKMVVLMIMRSNKPCYLIAKGFSLVSLECFAKIWKMAYQVFIALRQSYN